jgi:3-methylfumaryl-CoA hydratase
MGPDRAQAPPDLQALRQWIGRSEVDEDTAAEAPARLLAATLDRHSPPRQGDALPCLWHWLYFLPATQRSDLGEDGHPARGAFMPPVSLPRRMWAGSRIEFRVPVRIGEPIRRRATIADVVAKTGRAGPLIFVRVVHEIEGPHGLAIVEERDIVFRGIEAAGPAAEAKEATASAQWSESVVPDPVLLFRYSALTFNSHRIHYDGTYAREVEGYPGLVVTGPLIATLLAEAALARIPQQHAVRRLAFRSIGPLFANEAFTVAGCREGNRLELWAANARSRLAMSAQADLA